MSAFSRLGSILAGAVTATLLAGCSGAALQPATSTGLGAQSQHATPVVSTHPKPFVNVARVKAPAGNQIVIADAASATVTVWGANRQLNAILFDAITSDPRGLTTDSAESIYVANEGSSSVDVYAKPYTAITKTLEDPSWLTMDVAVSKSGVVAVTNYLTTGLAPGSVTFYAKDATTPCATVQDPNWIAFSNEAFDRLGNLFIDGQDANGRTLVGELWGGCAAASAFSGPPVAMKVTMSQALRMPIKVNAITPAASAKSRLTESGRARPHRRRSRCRRATARSSTIANPRDQVDTRDAGTRDT
jgi:hypothetical protein